MVSAPRDTVSAVRAMELAHAFMRDVAANLKDIARDPARRTAALDDLSLASKEINRAERADRSASIAIDDADGNPITLSLTNLKALALYYEGLCRSVDDPRRAVGILEQATVLQPDAAEAYYWLGLVHTDLFDRRRAVSALDKAIALDPGNLDYRKALGRAQNISGAQIAFESAATGISSTTKVIKWMTIGFVGLLTASLVGHLLDPATRVETLLMILAIVVGFGVLAEMIKIVWNDISGRDRS